MAARLKARAESRFLSKIRVDLSTGCWLWQSGLAHNGYGLFWSGKRLKMAHRWAYECYVGPIPDGLVTDHLCRVRECVNPGHLEIVTHRENIMRGEGHAPKNARKTRCRAGHPYSDENTYRHPNGQRVCRICARAYDAKYRKKRIDAALGNKEGGRGE